MLFNSWGHASVSQAGVLAVHAPKGAVGTHDVNIYVSDPRGGYTEVRLDVVVLDVPDPPSAPEVLGPTNGSVHAALGGIYFIVPRVTCREWLSRRFIAWHFWPSVYGVMTVVGASILGGFLQGQAQEAYDKPWMDAATRGYAYSIGTTLAWGFILFANLFFFLHLLVMWARLGRRSAHPTLLSGGRHGGSPHGPEGELDEPGATNA